MTTGGPGDAVDDAARDDPSEVGALTDLASLRGFFGTWAGLFAGASLALPLLNRWLAIVPVARDRDGGALAYLAPRHFAAAATVLALGAMADAFAGRARPDRSSTRRGTRASFRRHLLATTAVMGLYLGFVGAERAGLYPWITGSFLGLRHVGARMGGAALAFDVAMLGAYSVSFALLTRGFVVLGVSEYHRGRRGSAVP